MAAAHTATIPSRATTAAAGFGERVGPELPSVSTKAAANCDEHDEHPCGDQRARSQRQVLACCFSRRQSRTISAQATLSIVRVTVTEDSVEVLLSRSGKVLGLLGDIKVARGERFVPDHQVAPISHQPHHECPSYR
jgi:hypothetical protein